MGFAPLDDTGAQLLFRPVAAAYERRSLGIASHWPFDQWGRFLPEHTTAVSLLDRLLHHASVVVTDGDSYRMREARAKGGTRTKKNSTNPRGGDFHLATSGDRNLAVDRWPPRSPDRQLTVVLGVEVGTQPHGLTLDDTPVRRSEGSC